MHLGINLSYFANVTRRLEAEGYWPTGVSQVWFNEARATNSGQSLAES